MKCSLCDLPAHHHIECGLGDIGLCRNHAPLGLVREGFHDHIDRAYQRARERELGNVSAFYKAPARALVDA